MQKLKPIHITIRIDTVPLESFVVNGWYWITWVLN